MKPERVTLFHGVLLVAPSQGRELKPTAPHAACEHPKVAPSQGRELKLRHIAQGAGMAGRPFTGARVETSTVSFGECAERVAPSQGRELKQSGHPA